MISSKKVKQIVDYDFSLHLFLGLVPKIEQSISCMYVATAFIKFIRTFLPYLSPFLDFITFTHSLLSIKANCIVLCDWLNTRHALIGSFTHSITRVSFGILAPALFHTQ